MSEYFTPKEIKQEKIYSVSTMAESDSDVEEVRM